MSWDGMTLFTYYPGLWFDPTADWAKEFLAQSLRLNADGTLYQSLSVMAPKQTKMFPSFIDCNTTNASYCTRGLPPISTYVNLKYTADAATADGIPLYVIPYSVRKHGWGSPTTKTTWTFGALFMGESVLYSTSRDSNDPTATIYGHVRIFFSMKPCYNCGDWTADTLKFELPFTPNQEIVELKLSPDDTRLYTITTNNIHTYHVPTHQLTLNYESTNGIRYARVSNSTNFIYFTENIPNTNTVILKRMLILSNYVEEISILPENTRICQYPTDEDVTYTANAQLQWLNIPSMTTTRLLGTDRPASPELDTNYIASGNAQSANLAWGGDHHCVNLRSDFRTILYKDKHTLRLYTRDTQAASVTPTRSDAITDCQCAADSYGMITDNTSVCTRCPYETSSEVGEAKTLDDCGCFAGFERDPESASTECVPCDPDLGCLRDRLAPAEIRVKFRIGAQKEVLEQNKVSIEQAVATQINVPVSDVTVHGVKHLRMPSRRLLQQDGWLSLVDIGIAVDDGGIGHDDTTNANLANMTAKVQNSMSSITDAIATATNSTVDYDGTSCGRLAPPPGYWADQTSCTLIDVDECSYNPCHEIASCTNLPGSFSCDCPRGTYGDGFHCDGNTLSVRITLATNATENQYTTELKDNMARLYAAMLLTGTATGDPASDHQADHSISTFSKLPDGTVLIDIDVLFATTEMQAAALDRFDTLLFTIQANQQPNSNYKISVEYAPRKLTLMGLMTDSVERQGAKGLNVLSISFDPSCEPTGCWRIIARYSNSDPDSTAILYLPRTERDADGMSYSNSFVKTYIAAEFPCKSSSIPATGCCIPSVLSKYHTTAILAQETNTEPFSTAITVCDPNNPTAAPNPRTLLESKNYVIGSVDSLPASRIEYVRIVDPDLDVYEIEVILDEDELRNHMAQVIGDVNMEYELKTFIGMAYLTPMGTSSYFETQNTQTAISVRRTNYFTISTTGPIDFTNLDFSSAQLHETRVTYGLSVIQLQHVEVTIMFKNNIVPDTINGPFPLDGIRVGKGSTIDTVQWSHACYTSDGTGIFDSATTRAKFAASKAQQTCSRQIDICTQPASFMGNVLRINVPLGEDFWTTADLEDPNIGVYVDIVVKLRDSQSSATAFNVFRAYAAVVPAAIIQHCETREALTDLSSMLDVDLIVGTEILSVNETMPSGTYFSEIENTPGTGNSSSISIAAATIQSAMITIVVRGDPIFFDLTPRYYVDLNDAISIHFLESSPVAYLSVLSLVQLNQAFVVKVNETGFPFIEATPELLSVCSYNNLPNHMACVLRRDVTYTNAVTTNRAIELSRNAEEQAASFMTDIFSGSVTEFTQDLGRSFWRNVTTRFGVNDRYVRAWSFNPAHAWPLADVQAAGFSRSTLQTNLLVFALLSLRDSQAPQAATQRRLLQVTSDPSVRGEAPTFQSIENSAIDNTAQKCNAFGTAPEQCAVIDCTLRMPFKTPYCSILTSDEAYSMYYNDLKLIINRAFSADIARGYRVKHILPHSLSKLLETHCAGTSTIRRLLQTTMEIQSEVLFEVPENDQLRIDVKKLESGGIITKIAIVTSSDDSAFANIVDGDLSTGQNTQSTKSSNGISTGAIIGIVAGILVLVCMIYCVMEDNNHHTYKKSADL